MKKFLLVFSVVAVVAICFSSCAATKKDCRGVKHTRQPGGFYL
jgi:predicted small secreted protein